MVLTPVSGDAGTTWWPRPDKRSTSFEPMSPVPPITTIFMTISFRRLTRTTVAWAHACSPPGDPRVVRLGCFPEATDRQPRDPADMTMYLPNGDVRPTGYEAGEFLEPPPDATVADPSVETSEND